MNTAHRENEWSDRQGAIDAVFTIQVQFPEGRAAALIGANSSRSYTAGWVTAQPLSAGALDRIRPPLSSAIDGRC
jgi:hypothetical protein